MYCIHDGKCCVMVWDIEAGEYVYIPERKWDAIPKSEKLAKYRKSHCFEMADFDIAMF